MRTVIIFDHSSLKDVLLRTPLKLAQLKAACENYLQLDQILLRNDIYGFVKYLRKTAADVDRWVVTSRVGKDTRSSDKASPGGLTEILS
jgi:hypothetical protein